MILEKLIPNSYPKVELRTQVKSVQFSHSDVSDSLWPQGIQHARPPCPSPTPGVYSNMFIESVMPSNHLILYRPFLLPPAIFPSFRVFSFFFFIIISFYCSGFCHTLKWNSHGCTCVPHPDPPSHLPLHPIPLGLPSAPGPSTCLMHPTWAGDLFHPR